jgi:hypothetical protein
MHGLAVGLGTSEASAEFANGTQHHGFRHGRFALVKLPEPGATANEQARYINTQSRYETYVQSL